MTTPEKVSNRREKPRENVRQRNVGTRRVQRPVNPQETLDSTAHLAGSVFKSDIAAICLADEEGYLTVRSHVGLPPAGAARWRRHSSVGSFGEAFRTRRPRILTDAAQTEELAPGLSLSSGVIVPLCVGTTVIGCLCVGYKGKRRLSKQDVRLAILFGNYASVVIETAALYERESCERRRANALLEIVQTPRSGRDLKELLTRLSRAVLKLSVAERCVIFVVSEDERSVEAVLALGGKFPLRWENQVSSEISEAITPDLLVALAEGNTKPMVEERVVGRLVPKQWLDRFNIKSVAAFPLAYRRKAVGLMVVYTYSDYVSFPEEEVTTLAAVAKQIAILIENARLYERKQLEQRRSDMLNAALTAATSTLSVREVLSKVCGAALELTVGSAVSIFLVDEATGGSVPMMAAGRKRHGSLHKFLNAPAEATSDEQSLHFFQAVAKSSKPLFIEDATSSPFIGKWWVAEFGLKSLVAYPLRVKGRTIGAMTVDTDDENIRFPPEELVTLSAVATQVSVIIENARLYEREQRERQRGERVMKLLTAASSTLSLRQVCVKICEAALDLTVGDNISIFLPNEDDSGFIPMASVGGGGGPEETRTFLRPPADVLSSDAYRNGERMLARLRKPFVCEDASTSPFTHKWWIDSFNLKSLAYYPLIVKGRSIGIVTVNAMGEARKFPEEEIRTLSAVARQAAVIIENARLYEREKRQRQRSEKVAKLLATASSTLSVQQVCAEVCEAALELTVGDVVSVFIFDDEKHFRPMSAMGRGGREELKTFRNPPAEVQASPDIARFNRILRKRRKPIIIEDLVASPKANRWWIGTFGLKSGAYYPLRTKNKVIGFMAVVAIEKKRRFSKEEVHTLTSVAKQAAVVIENARLYEQQQAQRQRAEALVNVLMAAASTLTLKKVLSMLCEAVVDISVADRCSIFLMNESGTHLQPVMAIGAEDPELWEKFRNPRPGFETAPESQQLFQAVTTMEQPIIAEDAPASPFLEKWWVDTFNIKSLAQYPLRVKDRTIGMMTVDAYRHAVHFPKDEIDTLAAIAQQAAVIIENARIYEREQQQRQRAEALVDVLTTAASALGLKKVLVKICQTAVDISVADRCSVFIIGKDGRLAPMMSLGVDDPGLWERFRNAQALAGSAVESADLRRFYGQITKIEDPVVIEDAPSSTLIPKWWLEAFQVKSIVHYPLRIKDKTIGLMSIDAFRQPVHFPKEEIETLAAIAKQAAVVIENARLHDQLQEQAITDHVTGLFNHRHIFSRMDEEFARAVRSKSSFAVMMMDVDKFKDFNDTHGHMQGDEALRFIGQALRQTLRATDIVGRYGGDEFMAILPDTTREQAEEAGQRIVTMLSDTPFYGEGLEGPVNIAMSVGIASYPTDSTDREEMVMLADTALYEAKRLGGRRALPVSAPEFDVVPSQSLGFGLLQGLLNAIAHKDPYTIRHCEDNVRYVDIVADQLHLTADATESLRKAALLHDVGKIAIPDQTLLKPGPLDSSEWEVMQQHVRFGEMIVKGIAQISDAIEPVATHHERFDGKGYPRGIKGEQIPLLGRILAVVDAYSAMTLDRPYRKALSEEEAVEELRKGAGTQFDPMVVDAFLDALPGMKKQRKVA